MLAGRLIDTGLRTFAAPAGAAGPGHGPPSGTTGPPASRSNDRWSPTITAPFGTVDLWVSVPAVLVDLPPGSVLAGWVARCGSGRRGRALR